MNLRRDPNSFERDGRTYFVREAAVVPGTYNGDDDTIEIVWSAGGMVRRYDWRRDTIYWENLPLDPEHCDITRLNNGAPFLQDHLAATRFVLGVIIDGTVRFENGKGYARVRFSKAASKQEVIQDIRDGIIRKVSYGYDRSDEYEVSGKHTDGSEIRTYRMHTPMEASAVAIAADDDAGFRGSRPEQEDTMDLKARNAKFRAEGAKLKLGRSIIDDLCDDAILSLEDGLARLQTAWSEAQKDAGTGIDIKARNTEFRTLGARAKVPQAVIDELCDDPEITLEAGRAKLVEAWAGEQKDEPEVDTRHGGRVYVQEDERDKMRGAMVHGLGMRSAPDLFPREKAPAGAEDFRGARLPGILKMLGQRNGMRNLDRMSEAQMVDECLGLSGDGYRAAVQMTAGDFSAITSALANVSIARSYSGEQPSYRSFCGRRTAPDFNDMTEIDFGTSDVAEQLGEGGEIKFGKIVEGSRSWAVISFAKRYGLSRKLILNSRVDLLTQLPQKMVKLIVTLEQNQAWGVLLSSANLADGKPIFDATRGNISSVTKGVPGVTTMDAAFQLMGDQVDLDGTPMNLEPVNLLIPHAYRAQAATVLGGIVPNKPANATPDYMKSLGLIPEKRLAGTNAPWFAACDPEQHASIVYAMLDGYEAPRVSSRVGWDVQGVELKIEHDFGCTGLDGKGLVKVLTV